MRYIVYQDSVDGVPVVMWTHSSDGLNWSGPEALGSGEYPAIAVSEQDYLYIVSQPVPGRHDPANHYRPPGQTEWQIASLPAVNHPCIDVLDSTGVLVSEWQNDIYYSEFDQNANGGFFYAENISKSAAASSMPLVVTDIEYEDEQVHILYTEQDSNGVFSVKHAYVYQDDHDGRIITAPADVPELAGMRSVSASLRQNALLFAGDIPDRGMMTGASNPFFDPEYSYSEFYGRINPWENASPSIDDLGPKATKCALTWLQDGEVYGGTLHVTYLVPESVRQLSEDNGRKKAFPSVGYKTFRADSFDVVWTEGNGAPYDIMYGRYPKWPEKLACFLFHDDPLIYMQSNSIEWGFFGRGGYYNIECIDGPPGMDDVLPMVDRFYFSGTPEQSGEYNMMIIFSEYLNPSVRDTVCWPLTVINNAPEFVSSDHAEAYRGQRFDYRAEAADEDGNTLTYTFLNYPDYLHIYMQSLRCDNVPAGAHDTSFTVIATDGELSDTLHVALTVETSGIAAQSAVPEQFELNAVYPNPFNTVTQVRFALPEPCDVRIDVIDQNGRLAAGLAAGSFTAGRHIARWDASDAASGLYIIQMRAGEFMARSKCLLIK